MQKFLYLAFIFAFFTQNFHFGASRGASQSRSSFVGKRNSNMGHNIPTTSSTISGPLTSKEYLQDKGTFSAFTLILVIILVTVLALVVYYSVLCYPFLCRTEKNYQFMDVSSTITSATSRSMQSIENFPTGKSENYLVSQKSNEIFSSPPVVSEKHINRNFISENQNVQNL
ncbi:uncharacterized protein LOC129619360 [Condylostylus longicornis]|uniref:uncharacterized protein LOC129619360 n=1 Tax=Condylostylus longicornis TaxID=2530218 RepID=UPI00244DDB1F|nr:uncharacterized protein LOC129619360 [Condylostylus longicornis]